MTIGLHPWALGPFELLVHAEEHLRKGQDFDRRMALITFDDAIEVSITTYLSLHPIQRGNRSYQREDAERWLRDYHTKLDFLEAELLERSLGWEVERSHIVWVHAHRNEQYHGGSKGTPERNVLELTRRCARWVFSLLFDVTNVEQLIADRLARAAADQPERFAEFDRAIDGALGMIDVGSVTYYASELLFAVDYAAYFEMGAELSDSGFADVEPAA